MRGLSMSESESYTEKASIYIFLDSSFRNGICIEKLGYDVLIWNLLISTGFTWLFPL